MFSSTAVFWHLNLDRFFGKKLVGWENKDTLPLISAGEIIISPALLLLVTSSFVPTSRGAKRMLCTYLIYKNYVTFKFAIFKVNKNLLILPSRFNVLHHLLAYREH